MANSILSNERQCLICHTTLNLHKHHIFYGSAKRKLSDKYGCWCYLCGKHHNLSNESVHFNPILDIKLKQTTQKAFIKTYPNLDFIKIFGKSYL